MSVLDQPHVQREESRPAQPAAAPVVTPSTFEFLAWVASCPRTYAATMEAWQTSCPRNSVWEDAIADDLIRLESAGAGTMGETSVTLTPRGRAILDGN